MQTTAVIRNFILALVRYPNIQDAARKEIDRVIGRERVPTLADRASLPYIRALCCEALRWRLVPLLGDDLVIFPRNV